MRNMEQKFYKKPSAQIIVAAVLFALPLLTSCARYAPVPAVPVQRQLLDITLKTADPISNDIYYYIVMDTSGNTGSDGPSEIMTDTDRMKNWTYYIVLKNGQFSERAIDQPSDRDLLPAYFTGASPNYYSVSAASDTIHVVMYMENLIPDARRIWFNFITSRNAVTDNVQNITAIDYIPRPRFSIQSNLYNSSVTNLTTLLDHPVDAGQPKAADIVSWSVRTTLQ